MISSSTESCQSLNTRMMQNYHLVWLDRNIDKTNDKWSNSITELHQAAYTINTFIDADQCIDFITDTQETAFVIVSDEFSETVLSVISDVTQVQYIFIFCESHCQHEGWLKKCLKVFGIYTEIKSICEELQKAVHDFDQNTASISLIKKNDGIRKQNQDTLDCSFMYTQMLKKTLLTLDFNAEHFQEFILHCREEFASNSRELRKIDKIEKEYRSEQAIQWYTYESFLYSMVNRVLRVMDVKLIVKMGFFIRDLHNHLTTRYLQQYSGQIHSYPFTVYRGQVLPQIDFDQLKANQGGLLAFNTFLSTTSNPEVARGFAQKTASNSNLVRVLFIMKIDPTISTTPFAKVQDITYHVKEEEILFSMHSVFQIVSVQQIQEENSLSQVILTLSNESDPDLQILMEALEGRDAQANGWLRLGRLMIRLAEYDKSQELYEMILHQTANKENRGVIYSHLGFIKANQGDHQKALAYYEKALEIAQKALPPNHPHLATSYNNIAGVYHNMGEYSKALAYYEKALEIAEKALPPNHPDLATSYNNIAVVYRKMGEYSTALAYYEKALEIAEKALPPNHPDLATSYNNIAVVYDNMSEYSEAVVYYEKALKIAEKALPPNHPDLATSYNNIAGVYHKMGEYSKALAYYEKALEIRQKALPPNHPDLATSYNNIAGVYRKMGEYSEALKYLKQALEIAQKALHPNHPDLATSYNNIAVVYRKMGKYSEALRYLKQALEIRQQFLPSNHPDLVGSYNNIGNVYDNMGEYSTALAYYEKAFEIREKALP